MAKRTIATVRQLINEVNSITPMAPPMSFRKKGIDRYILIFKGTTHDREFGPLACGEACEFINGIIYARSETTTLLNEQMIASLKNSRELNLVLNQTILEQKERLHANAKGLHDMFLRADVAEKELKASIARNREMRSLVSQLNCKVRDLEYHLEEETHMHNES